MTVLIDTSVWVQFFRGRGKALCDRVEQLVVNQRACCNGIVLGELLHGARGPQEAEEIRRCLFAVRIHVDTPEVFAEAGGFGADLRRAGVTIPLTDLVIATQARREHLAILTADRHFTVLAEALDIQTELVSPVEGSGGGLGVKP